jgi:hypothetical protein
MIDLLKIWEKLKLIFSSKLFFYFIYGFIFLLLFILINIFAVNVPYWDQWRTVDALIKYHENNLTILNFWDQHNESRMIFPLLIEFAIAYLSNLNVVYELYVSLLLIFVISVIFYKAFINEFKNLSYKYLYFVPALLILVSFRQYQNLLWGFEICIYLSVLCVILSIFILIHYDSYKGLLLAMLTAVIAAYSFTIGLSILPIGVIILLILNRKKSDIISWVIFSIITLALFFWNWSGNSSIRINFDSILHSFIYFLVILGSPMADSLKGAAVMGLLFLTIALLTFYLLYKNNLLKINYFWILILLFSFSCLIMNSIGRNYAGITAAFVSRYTPFAIVGIISLYCLVLSLSHFTSENCQKGKIGTFLLGSITVLIIIGLFLGNIQGFQEFAARNPLGVAGDNLLNDQYYLLTYKNQSDEKLSFFYPRPHEIKENIMKMEKYRLNIFGNYSGTIQEVPMPPQNSLSKYLNF